MPSQSCCDRFADRVVEFWPSRLMNAGAIAPAKGAVADRPGEIERVYPKLVLKVGWSRSWADRRVCRAASWLAWLA